MRVSRRSFLAASGGALGLCILPGCSGGGAGDDGGAPDLALPPDLARAGDLRTCAGDYDGGLATDIQQGCMRWVTNSIDIGFFISRDAGGLYAVSAICTHEGCFVGTVNATSLDPTSLQCALPGRTPFFRCPCHGSQYAVDGTLIRGVVPGQAPLDHFALCITADGRLSVDPNTTVPASTRV